MEQIKKPHKQVPNPTGKGGFQDHPELRSSGHWIKDNSYGYWLNKLKSLSPEEFVQFKPPTMAAVAALERIKRSPEKLEEFVVVANRTEGMPHQTGEYTFNLAEKMAEIEKGYRERQ